MESGTIWYGLYGGGEEGMINRGRLPTAASSRPVAGGTSCGACITEYDDDGAE